MSANSVTVTAAVVVALLSLAAPSAIAAQGDRGGQAGSAAPRSWAIGATLQGDDTPGGFQVGYRLAPHRELVLGATVGRPTTTLSFGEPFEPGNPFQQETRRFPNVYTEIATRGGVRLSSRAAGDGVYVLPFVRIAYGSEFTDEYAAALERDDLLYSGSARVQFRDEAGARLGAGAELGYRFHFLRFLYGDAAGFAITEDFFGGNDGQLELSARFGLGFRF